MVIEERVTMRPSRRPVHPGAFLRRNVLPALGTKGVTMVGFAAALGVTRQSLYAVLNAQRAVSPEMAVRLGRCLGNAPQFWLNMQANHDIWEAEYKPAVRKVVRLVAA